MKTCSSITLALAALALAVSSCISSPKAERSDLPEPTYENLPRWRGFNLLEKFSNGVDEFATFAPMWTYFNEPFRESDFEMISEFGFNFVRLPMSYRCWTPGEDLMDFDEKTLKEIDQAVAWGKKYNIHVSINMHRAPGYCINLPREEFDLWTDPAIQKVFAAHWAMFAERYKGIPNTELSFDLVNEPLATQEQYAHVIKLVVDAIREIDPDRLIIIDGIGGGNFVMEGIEELNVAQSGRGYQPTYVTHFRTSWNQWWNNSPQEDYMTYPTWPYTAPDGTLWNAAKFDELYEPWIKYRDEKHRGIHIGEFGVNKYTPHSVALDFLTDLTGVLKKNDIGWAMWQFRGPVGILDSERDDVIYEPYKGHKLDRKMLEILQAN